MSGATFATRVVSLQMVRSAQVEAQRLAREKLLEERDGIQAEIDALLGRLVRDRAWLRRRLALNGHVQTLVAQPGATRK